MTSKPADWPTWKCWDCHARTPQAHTCPTCGMLARGRFGHRPGCLDTVARGPVGSGSAQNTPRRNAMPKLDTKTAKAVNSADTGGGGFTLLDEDEYVLKLVSCKVTNKPNRNGDLGWVWQFEVSSGTETGDKFKSKPIRTNTWLSEDSHWFLKQMFDAFEVKPNVDTDTLVGKEIKAVVTQREIAAGSRKGQMSNDISSMMPVSATADDDDDWNDDEGSKDDPDF